MNLCSAGRDVMFPVVDLSRLQPALLIFETAVARDPHSIICGYAGAAQVETMLAILAVLQNRVQKHMLKPLQVKKAPARWSIAARCGLGACHARAWLEFALGNYDQSFGAVSQGC